MKRRQAFTLVELLVVIGVIAVLVAMLLPALTRARQAATTLKCAANMRQIGQMFGLYAADYPGFYPPVNWKKDLDPNIPNTNSYGMVHCLGPYMGQKHWAGSNRTAPYIHLFTAGDRATFARSVFVCPEYTPTGYSIQPYLSGIAESGYLILNSTPPTITEGHNTLPRRISKFRRPLSSLIHVASSCTSARL